MNLKFVPQPTPVGTLNGVFGRIIVGRGGGMRRIGSPRGLRAFRQRGAKLPSCNRRFDQHS